MTTYTFSSDIKFGERKKYEYVPFQGKQFIDDYLDDRAQFLIAFPQTNIHETLHDLCSDVCSFCKQPSYERCNICFLCNIILENSTENISESEILKMNELIKKYEIKRRIYHIDRKMHESNTPITASDVIAFPLFAIALLKIFRSTKNYQYLSTALKVNDMIASNIHVIKKCEKENTLTQISFFMELEIMKEIMKHENI